MLVQLNPGLRLYALVCFHLNHLEESLDHAGMFPLIWPPPKYLPTDTKCHLSIEENILLILAYFKTYIFILAHI